MNKRKLFLLSTLLVISVQLICQALQAQENKTASLDLSISTAQAKVEVDGRIRVRVEITNRAKEHFTVGWLLSDLVGAPTTLQILVFDANGRQSPSEKLTIGQDSHLTRRWWINLRPGYFYGTDITVDGSTYSFLRTPGRYKLLAIYQFRYSPEEEGKPNSNASSDLRQPKLWTGKLESNDLWIEIMPKSPAEPSSEGRRGKY